MFKFLKRNAALNRLNEEQFYSIAINEIKNGQVRDGLMGKAYASANGDEKKAEANYIKLRVQQLIDEEELNKFDMEMEVSSIISQSKEEERLIKEKKARQEGKNRFFLPLFWSIILTAAVLTLYNNL